MNLWDTTAYEESYDRLRPLSYVSSNMIVCMFSCSNRKSFESLSMKWFPEVRHYCPSIPIIVCCTKIDLREDAATLAKLATNNQTIVTTEEGEAMAKQLGAIAYVETSSLVGTGLIRCFETIAAASYVSMNAAKIKEEMSKNSGNNKKCTIQ